MKFSAYMFIRNGIRGGYTFMEAIENVLPFVDEFYILDGDSDDGTKEALFELAKLDPRIRVESREPKYVSAPKDDKGWLLGEVFDEARQACAGDWLVQVQADTVFHPETIAAARYFLERDDNARKYGAIEVVRRQYRWNWQEMYRRDNLALIFKKDAGKVSGDAINVVINGIISRALGPLFEKYPAADNAWIFFENIAGKRTGCREIWEMPEINGEENSFSWYDKATGRNFAKDLHGYLKDGTLPPFWLKKTSPYVNWLPGNLAGLVGIKKYSVADRYKTKEGVYSPSVVETVKMLAGAGELRPPLREVLLKLFK